LGSRWNGVVLEPSFELGVEVEDLPPPFIEWHFSSSYGAEPFGGLAGDG
jgi:hypothetical protein